MSWTDSQSIRVINYLREKAQISTLVETGTFKGVNAQLHAKTFPNILTCEKVDKYFKCAKERLKNLNDVTVVRMDSPDFIKRLPSSNFIFYLDAHFYNPLLPPGAGKFVILEELKNMRRFKNSIIIIHDFHNGLGGVTYDDIDLDMDLVKEPLLKINKNFYFYTNTLEGCDIVKPTKKSILNAGLNYDHDTIDNLKYAWSSQRLTYRGFLYALPFELTKEELKMLGLRKWG